MVINCRWFNFSFVKIKPYSGHRMVYCLADNFDFSRCLFIKEKRR